MIASETVSQRRVMFRINFLGFSKFCHLYTKEQFREILQRKLCDVNASQSEGFDKGYKSLYGLVPHQQDILTVNTSVPTGCFRLYTEFSRLRHRLKSFWSFDQLICM